MAKVSMSVRIDEADKRLIDAISFVLSVPQIDVLTSGLRLYMESLDAETQERIKQADALKK